MTRRSPAEIAALNAAQAKSAAPPEPIMVTVQGPRGETGIQGVQGPTGPRGPVGVTGATGPLGPIGDTGPLGPKGAVGPVGPKGPVGAVGPAGQDGVGPDEKVKLDASDPEAGYLEAKLQPGLNVKFRRSKNGKALVIDATGGGAAISTGGGRGPAGPQGPPGPQGEPGTGGPGSDDQTAAEVPFTPAGSISATNVQDAIEEVAAEAGSISILPDPGNVWEADTVVALGYRVAVPGVNLSFLVWEVTDAGTTGGSDPDWEAVPLASGPITDNDVEWTFQGYVGKILGGALSIEAAPDASGNTGSSIITEDATADAPGDLYIRGGHGAAGVAGGTVGLQGGKGDGGSSPLGAYVLVSGGTDDGEGGEIGIVAGYGTLSAGASIFLHGGGDGGPGIGGGFVFNAGNGGAAAAGGNVNLTAGLGNEDFGVLGGEIQILGADGVGNPGKVGIRTNDSTGTAGQVLTANGADLATWEDAPGTPAADPGDIADPTIATAETVALKLNALMAAMRTAGSLA